MSSTPTSDVPVFVEDSRVIDGEFPLVRCNYLTIERDEPAPGWTLTLGSETLPFTLVHLGGVITQPAGSPRFAGVSAIDDLYASVEKDELLTIDVADLWLPAFLFQSSLYSGDVYRMSSPLFGFAFRYRHGSLDAEHFLMHCKDRRDGLTPSTEETSAFREWHDQQLNRAKETFPKNRDLQLRRREAGR